MVSRVFAGGVFGILTRGRMESDDAGVGSYAVKGCIILLDVSTARSWDACALRGQSAQWVPHLTVTFPRNHCAVIFERDIATRLSAF